MDLKILNLSLMYCSDTVSPSSSAEHQHKFYNWTKLLEIFKLESYTFLPYTSHQCFVFRKILTFPCHSDYTINKKGFLCNNNGLNSSKSKQARKRELVICHHVIAALGSAFSFTSYLRSLSVFPLL